MATYREITYEKTTYAGIPGSISLLIGAGHDVIARFVDLATDRRKSRNASREYKPER
jgi:hypothetical protein